VDVFFVISGYLITSIIRDGLAHGDFSFRSFYARRARRILPALLVVLAFTFAAGQALLLQPEMVQLSKHLVAGAAFFANFQLAAEVGYFDSASDLKPLLHLWSLSIEEQFYLLWPLIAWAIWRLGIRLLYVTAALAFASFAWNVWHVDTAPAVAFYWPQSRAWELFAGCLLAVWAGKLRLPYPDHLSVVGATLLAASFWLIEPHSSFPGYLALIPVAGTGLLIAAGPQAFVNRTLLATGPLVWVGLISYPLYLWHWPLLSFASIHSAGEVGALNKTGLVALAFVLAWATYRYLERPVRYGNWRWTRYGTAIAGATVVGLVALWVHASNVTEHQERSAAAFLDQFENSRPEWRLNHRLSLLEAYRTDCGFYDLEAYRNGMDRKTPTAGISPSCHTRDASKPHVVLIWGDSHAQQYNYGLSKRMPANWQVMQVASSGCAPQIKSDYATETNFCDRSNFTARATVQKVRPDVVLVGQVSLLDVTQAKELDREIRALGAGRVVFAGPTPQWQAPLPNIVARSLWPNPPERTKAGLKDWLFAKNDEMRKAYQHAGLEYVDVVAAFCNSDGCLTRIGTDALAGITSHDYGHLLPVASEYLATKTLVRAIMGSTSE